MSTQRSSWFNKCIIVSVLALQLLLGISCESNVQKSVQKSVHSGRVTTLAFGSCNKQTADQSYWKDISAQDPDAWIWLGDNIYGDSDKKHILKKKYESLKNNQHYKDFISGTAIYGIWDDHDYGKNNAGKEFSIKAESRDLLFEFLDIPESYPAWKREGAYQSYTFTYSDDNKIKLLLLDSRYFRDPVRYDNRRATPQEEGSILGEDQWKWLKKELEQSYSSVTIIANGIQVLPEDHPYEKWANFPNERTRLLKLISNSNTQNCILLSGDRHIAEMSKVQHEGQDIYEITSSGLTHSYENVGNEENRHRVSPLISERNFGTIKVHWEEKRIELQIRSIQGNLLHSEVIDIN